MVSGVVNDGKDGNKSGNYQKENVLIAEYVAKESVAY
jgi:hypothetical protein